MSNSFATAVEDVEQLERALAEANIAPALMVLVHLTGNTEILDEAAPYIQGPWNHMESIPAPLKHKVRRLLVEALKQQADSPRALTEIDPSLLHRMMSSGTGQPVPQEYIPLLLEETQLDGQDRRRLTWSRDRASLALEDFKVVIVGAGFTGILAGIRLKQAGIPFIILEKNASAGGTWYENDYPGCGVDTASHFYSFSFLPNPLWSHYFAKRNEIYQYLEDAVDQFGIREHIVFGTEVTRMMFDEQNRLWDVTHIDATGKERTERANASISAVGLINRPSVPDIPGLASFQGPVVHTAAWDKTLNLKDKRVALVGTGASGMQVGPALAPIVEKLSIFQRSPHWAGYNPMYHQSVPAGQKWALQHIPLFSEWQRFLFFWGSSDGLHASLHVDPNWHLPDVSLNEANHKVRQTLIEHITKELDGDPSLMAKCIPSYPPYGKRMLRDNHWYKMLKRPNVELVTEPISAIEGDAIITHDGLRHTVDAIVMATGFHAGKMLWPMEVVGRGGITIRDVWGDEDPSAYKGITVPNFPNFFVTSGPNTGLAHGGSHFFHSECQIKYITQALKHMIEHRLASVEVTREAHDHYNEKVGQNCQNMVWAHPGVRSWYKNSKNRVTIISPWKLLDYWNLTREFDSSVYHCVNAKKEVATT